MPNISVFPSAQPSLKREASGNRKEIWIALSLTKMETMPPPLSYYLLRRYLLKNVGLL